ncbi:unnamed protein product [Rangifer tarandus platyrhynchus]|uniref:Uncharacterized protein n=1 Tax=Rangifer tarandus platyrhynchus TaxID=3082113 RepID=A0AC59YU95_RANTA
MPGAGNPGQESEWKRHGGAGSCSSRQFRVTSAWSTVRVNLEEAKGGEVANGASSTGSSTRLAPPPRTAAWPALPRTLTWMHRRMRSLVIRPALHRPASGAFGGQDLA